LAIPPSIVLETPSVSIAHLASNFVVDRLSVGGGGSSIDRCGDASGCKDGIGGSQALAPQPQPLAGVNLASMTL
jgi:hypothetical protein